MGGNMRHASKGPDRRSSQCGECDETFEHGKYSHPDYCSDCRDDRRTASNVSVIVDANHDPDVGQIVVEIRIENENDVPVRDISLERTDEYVDVVGYVRVEGEDCAAENAWIVDSTYSSISIRPGHRKSAIFVWDDDGFRQDETPTMKGQGVVGEEFREFIACERGDPFEESELDVQFVPANDDEWLEEATDTIDIASYMVDL